MKRLLVLRHAKSDWGDPAQSDFERPLNQRGERDAPRIGLWLASQGLQPDTIVSSPAVRAARTAHLVAEASGCGAELIRFEPAIYEARPETLLQLVTRLADDWWQPLLIGHNPGLHQLIELLSGETLAKLPTCSLALLDLEIERWEEAVPGCAGLGLLQTPKTLP